MSHSEGQQCGCLSLKDQELYLMKSLFLNLSIFLKSMYNTVFLIIYILEKKLLHY